MARNFYTPINLNVLELQNAVIGNLSTSSINALSGAGLSKGRLQFDSTANTMKYYDGTAWQTISTGGGSFTLGSTSISLGSTTTTIAGLTSVTSTTFVGALTGNASTATTLATARAINGVNFDGSAAITVTAAAGTLSGSTLNSGVTASSLTSVGTLSSLTLGGAIAMGTNKITGLGDPTAAQDAATKNYVDTLSQGLNVHDSVTLATAAAITAGLTYTAGSTGADGGTGVGATLVFTAVAIDGVTLTSTDVTNGTRILVKDQSTQTQNGIYVVTTVSTNITLTRATDADNHVAKQITAGDFVYVVNGTANTGKSFVQATLGTATGGGVKIGTDNIVYNQFGSAGTVPYATTSTAGIASFSSTYFSVSGVGAVSLSSLGSLNTTGNAANVTGTVAVANGGTGATTAAAARTNLGATTKVTLVGTGSGTTIALTHGLGTNLVTAQVYDTSTSTATLVEVDITVTSTVATATFAATTTLSNYTLVVIG